nr:LysR family transcriptional regulator [Sphingomonas paucimobilis]
MKPLDLNLLRVLDALFSQGNVSGAARALGVTQPGVSIALRRLRDHFGDDLFVRQSGRMVPTALAERLRTPVTQALGVIETDVLPASAFDPQRSDRSFVIGLSDLGDLVFLPDLMARLKESAPHVTVRSIAAEPAGLVEGMAHGTIDLMIGHLTDSVAGLYAQTLFVQYFVCLVRADHPRIADTLTLEQFLAADHIVVSQDGRSQEVFERRVRQLGLDRRITLHSPHFMSVPLLVARSDMITVVPQAVGRIYAHLLGLKLLALPFDVPGVELRQFWHRRSHTDQAAKWLRKLVATCFVGRDPTDNPESVFWSRFAEHQHKAPDEDEAVNAK